MPQKEPLLFLNVFARTHPVVFLEDRAEVLHVREAGGVSHFVDVSDPVAEHLRGLVEPEDADEYENLNCMELDMVGF